MNTPVPMAAEAQGSFAASLRAQCDRTWAGLHAHPFLREIARGVLPLEKFRFFIEQDLLFLPEYARCMAMGAAKSQSEEELEFFTKELDGTIRLEIPSNRRLLDALIKLGAQDRGGALGMAPANVAYTSFLLATAARDGTLEIVAAILPCAWSYAEIAGRLAGELAEHPVYAEWVGFYLTEEMSDLVRVMRETFDSAVQNARLGAGRRQRLAEIFQMSSRLEEEFWQMAYTLHQWPDLRTGAAVGE